MEEIKLLLDKYPYLTYLTYGGNDFVGIVQNADEQITTIYDFALLKTPEQKTRFLELGETWWWESNRIIPINVFLKSEWAESGIVIRQRVAVNVARNKCCEHHQKVHCQKYCQEDQCKTGNLRDG